MAGTNDFDSSYNWKEESTLTRFSYRNPQKPADNVTFHETKDFYYNSGCSNGFDKDISNCNGFYRHHQPLKLKTSSSGPEIRFINPAIYTESVETNDENDTTTEVQIRIDQKKEIKFPTRNFVDKRIIEVNCGDAASMVSSLPLKKAFTTPSLDYAGDQYPSSQETYRCYSSTSINAGSTAEPSTARTESGDSTKPVTRVERRCRIGEKPNEGFLSARQNEQSDVQRYILNGHRVVQVSTTSLSSTDLSQCQKINSIPLARKLAHEEWVRKKQLEQQKKKEEEEMLLAKKREEEERLQREKEEKERLERENFMKWSERKKEEAEKKAQLDKELEEMEQKLKELEGKASAAKNLRLRQWARKKEEEQKAQLKAQQMKEKKEEEERKRRQEDSVKAYEEWREKSKNRPKPATQGLLPHQAAKPSFVNPTPWQSIVENESDETQEDKKKSKGKRKDKSKKTFKSK